ncbi:S8 family serine peptidase [Mameliella alba]|nr:S8 family serine peptidase [Antarctobacter heliothermus]MBY6142836.1 S8 family serine peptidase [Mameliella alba]MBY6159691.1 S8 family serine peptidase [Mameliella alba]MBY6168162.1 S8 family serine peptidase [Mameliella alba]MBY6173183.1 S8 family serine peptidase [Mameliella alba]
MTRYILLRDKAGNWRRPEVPLTARVAPQDPQGGAAPDISVADLTPDDLRDAANDPALLTIQPAMPTRLLSPQPMDDLRAADAVPGWGLHAIGADWTPFDGSGVRVALLDTGIDATHPAFAGVTITARDFAGTGVADANGHGTHVAGTLLGRDLGGTRIGVARGVTDLLVAKAVGDDGAGRSEDLLRAILWALQEKADVVGFSLSFDTPAQVDALTAEGYPQALATSAAVHAYRGNLRICEILVQMIGCGEVPLILGAVGNDSLRTIGPEFETGPAAPTCAEGILAIGACTQGETGLAAAPFSNTGAALVAPGTGIISAGLGGGLRTLNGTSMAMAHTAGIAALWAQKRREDGKQITARSLAATLIRTASRAPLSQEASPRDCGAGLVQAPRGALD